MAGIGRATRMRENSRYAGVSPVFGSSLSVVVFAADAVFGS
jgi:hypothetical protein